MRYQYLIFDLDETLYPKESGLLTHINRRIDLFIQRNLKIPETEIAKLRYEYLERYGTTLGGMIARHHIDPEEYIKDAYNVKIADFIKPNLKLGKILNELDVKKVVFSNSPMKYVKEVLKALEIRDYFEKVFDIRFCDFLGKPNLSSYYKVMMDLGVEGKDCLFVDDTPANVLGGEKAGIASILLGQPTVNSIKWAISDLAELPMIIPKIQGQLTA